MLFEVSPAHGRTCGKVRALPHHWVRVGLGNRCCHAHAPPMVLVVAKCDQQTASQNYLSESRQHFANANLSSSSLSRRADFYLHFFTDAYFVLRQDNALRTKSKTGCHTTSFYVVGATGLRQSSWAPIIPLLSVARCLSRLRAGLARQWLRFTVGRSSVETS